MLDKILAMFLSFFENLAHEKNVFLSKACARKNGKSGICSSRQELSNEYLIAKIGVDTAENGPSKVWDRNLTKFDEPSSSG